MLMSRFLLTGGAMALLERYRRLLYRSVMRAIIRF